MSNRWFGMCLALVVLPTSISLAGLTTTGLVYPTDPATWDSGTRVYIGDSSDGSLLVDNGSDVASKSASIGYASDVVGEMTVDGSGSTWTNVETLLVGRYGSGTLNITNGASVSNYDAFLARYSSSTGMATVDGDGSVWTNNGNLSVGEANYGELTISNNGLVSVAGALSIDADNNDHGFINMKTGGTLALAGDVDDSLDSFLGLIGGSAAIRFWDDSLSGWTAITEGTMDVDYSLTYLTDGELADYTLLTVLNTRLPGDANLDGLVDVGDLGILAANYGSSGKSWEEGDFTGDGAVDVGDLGVLAANYGSGTSAMGIGFVPEPATLSLLMLAGVGFLRRR